MLQFFSVRFCSQHDGSVTVLISHHTAVSLRSIMLLCCMFLCWKCDTIHQLLCYAPAIFLGSSCSSSDTKLIVVEESVKPASTSSKVLQVPAVTHCGVNVFKLQPDHLSGSCEMLYPPSSSLHHTVWQFYRLRRKFNSYRHPLTLFRSTEKSLAAARVLFSKFDNWQLEFQVVLFPLCHQQKWLWH